MARKRVPIVPTDPYHISSRCVNREWFALPLPTVWSVMEDYLYLIKVMFDVYIHAFVLMSNHYHLIMTAPSDNMSDALLYFGREVSKQINRLSGRENQVFGSRNHKTRIAEWFYFVNTYRYIYQNPVRAGICKRVESYPYSTLPGLVGLQRLGIPVAEDQILFNPGLKGQVLEWLNTVPTIEQDRKIKLALRRPEFEFKTSRETGKAPDLDAEWEMSGALFLKRGPPS